MFNPETTDYEECVNEGPECNVSYLNAKHRLSKCI